MEVQAVIKLSLVMNTDSKFAILILIYKF